MGTELRSSPASRPAGVQRLPVDELVARLATDPDVATLAELLWRMGHESESYTVLYSLPPGFVLDRLPHLLLGLRDAAFEGDLTAAAALLQAARAPAATPAVYLTRGILKEEHLRHVETLVRDWARAGRRGAVRVWKAAYDAQEAARAGPGPTPIA